MFLGDCENRLVLVKIYKVPAELPDAVLISRLSHYDRVMSFRRDRIAQFVQSGVRTDTSRPSSTSQSSTFAFGIQTSRNPVATVVFWNTWFAIVSLCIAAIARSPATALRIVKNHQHALVVSLMSISWLIVHLSSTVQTWTSPQKSNPRKREKTRRRNIRRNLRRRRKSTRMPKNNNTRCK